MDKTIKGRNGGILIPQVAGEKGKPGAGRTVNQFKAAILKHADGVKDKVELAGFLIIDGKVTKERVKVLVSFPAVDAVVIKMFKRAAKKGDVAAARWLSETGYGKQLNLSNDPDSPIGSGFVVAMPPNNR
jgi:hypothetical protein